MRAVIRSQVAPNSDERLYFDDSEVIVRPFVRRQTGCQSCAYRIGLFIESRYLGRPQNPRFQPHQSPASPTLPG